MGMHVGEVHLLRITAAEGYSAGGFPFWGISQNADLEFELEVLNIETASICELPLFLTSPIFPAPCVFGKCCTLRSQAR